MKLEWLDDVIVLLEEGNLSRAAARRNITQPAFSRRIQGFEEWLGIAVLDRQVNRVDVHPALQSSETEIRALVKRLRELPKKIAAYEATRTTVAIAAQHAPLCSAFPDMALKATSRFPGLQFRPRAGNLNDCVSMFLRGDTSMLLCYEAQSIGALQFGANIQRGVWGNDYLVPVVGGSLRYRVTDGGAIPLETPAIVYPDDSYFGEVLHRNARVFGTLSFSETPFSITAFSSGTREMILAGLGVGWLPFSMIYRELENGDLISLAERYGKETLEVAVYADNKSVVAMDLMGLWAQVSESGRA